MKKIDLIQDTENGLILDFKKQDENVDLNMKKMNQFMLQN